MSEEIEFSKGQVSGAWLRAMRKANGLSQQLLAHEANVSKSYVCHMEAGRRPVSADVIRKLAELSGPDFFVPATQTNPAELEKDFGELVTVATYARLGELSVIARHTRIPISELVIQGIGHVIEEYKIDPVIQQDIALTSEVILESSQ